MESLAVLITCHNRKEKTLQCLRNLYKAYDINNGGFLVSLYITDDGCTDGTVESVLYEFSDRNITILQGSGSLYWAGGMRFCWEEALRKNFKAYLLLNDDTNVNNEVFVEFSNTHNYCLNKFSKGGIYIGTTTISIDNDEISYGGRIILNRWNQKTQLVIPNGKTPQQCDLGNANIMFVATSTVDEIGILHEAFIHGLADYDYTLYAKKMKIPVLVTPNICGVCVNDHPFNMDLFAKKDLVERIKNSYSPLGLALYDCIEYYKRNFWYRVPFVFLISWIRIISPSIYKVIQK
jgi:GT2 family glycosyltransferase